LTVPKLSISYTPTNGVTRELLAKYDMRVEVGQAYYEDAVANVADLVASVHLPWNEAELGRHNYAAVDNEFRRVSIDRIRAAIVFAGRHFPAAEVAVLHGAPYRWMTHEHEGGRVGDYELFIAGLREFADLTAQYELLLTLENNNCYWVNAAGEFSWEDAAPTPDMRYFGCTPEHWLAAYDDVAHANLKLCLDTAHACTYAHTIADHGERTEALLSYVARPEAIAHVHWNGHQAFEPEGRTDKHLNVGKGSIPEALHRRVKQLDASHLLEHYHGEDALIEELAYIDAL
jgi:sugar phosphate isomerase/epimerase